jgi:hypothetical protein
MLRPTVSRPVCLGKKARIWGLRPDFYYCLTVAGLLIWGVLSDESTGLSFTIAVGPRQRSHSWVRVPWDSRPYFTVSDSRLPSSSPHTSRRAMVEVFDPDSIRETWVSGYIASGPLLLRIRCNVLTESLLSNEHRGGPHRKHLLQHLFYCVRELRALLSNRSTLLLVTYLLRARSPNRCLAMGICITIYKNDLVYSSMLMIQYFSISLWEPSTAKQALLNQRSPRQLQRPLASAPPSDKSTNMRAYD